MPWWGWGVRTGPCGCHLQLRAWPWVSCTRLHLSALDVQPFPEHMAQALGRGSSAVLGVHCCLQCLTDADASQGAGDRQPVKALAPMGGAAWRQVGGRGWGQRPGAPGQGLSGLCPHGRWCAVVWGPQGVAMPSPDLGPHPPSYLNWVLSCNSPHRGCETRGDTVWDAPGTQLRAALPGTPGPMPHPKLSLLLLPRPGLQGPVQSHLPVPQAHGASSKDTVGTERLASMGPWHAHVGIPSHHRLVLSPSRWA